MRRSVVPGALWVLLLGLVVVASRPGGVAAQDQPFDQYLRPSATDTPEAIEAATATPAATPTAKPQRRKTPRPTDTPTSAPTPLATPHLSIPLLPGAAATPVSLPENVSSTSVSTAPQTTATPELGAPPPLQPAQPTGAATTPEEPPELPTAREESFRGEETAGAGAAPESSAPARRTGATPRTVSAPGYQFGATSKAEWLGRALWGLLALIAVGFVLWVVSVALSLQRRKQYQQAMYDSLPSAEERLLSELTTLQVSLLRGNVFGYYEKLAYLVRQVLRSRGLIENRDPTTDQIVGNLRTLKVDSAFLQSVESILRRCDAVRLENARPDRVAHEKIAEDLEALIRTRLPAVRPREKSRDDSKGKE